MNKELQRLIEELGEAIHSSLSSSDRFAEVMVEIEKAGYDVYVVLEASIGFRSNGGSEAETGETEIQLTPQPRRDPVHNHEMTAADLEFLKSLKISLA